MFLRRFSNFLATLFLEAKFHRNLTPWSLHSECAVRSNKRFTLKGYLKFYLPELVWSNQKATHIKVWKMSLSDKLSFANGKSQYSEILDQLKLDLILLSKNLYWILHSLLLYDLAKLRSLNSLNLRAGDFFQFLVDYWLAHT